MIADEATADQVIDAMRDQLRQVLRGNETDVLDTFLALVDDGLAARYRDTFPGNEAAALDAIVATLPAGAVFRLYNAAYTNPQKGQAR